MQEQTFEGYRLSPQQERLWASRPRACVQGVLAIKGDLKTAQLQRALQTVVERHEILRTTFRKVPGLLLPLQVIGDAQTTPWRAVDIGKSNQVEINDRIREELIHDAEQVFDLENGPLLRVSLLGIQPESHSLLVTLPGLCADHLTILNLARKLNALYTGADHKLEGEEPQYLQFSEWCHELLETDDESSQSGRAFWKNLTGSLAQAPQLPFEETSGSREHKRISFKVDKARISISAAFANKYEEEVCDFLLACWQVVLFRLSRQTEIVVSTHQSGRKYDELIEAMGPFADFLPLQLSLSSELRFDELLRQVGEAREAVTEWQEYFNPDPDASSAIGFTFVSEPRNLQTESDDISLREVFDSGQPFKLHLTCTLFDDNLSATLDYQSGTYNSQDIERLAGYLQKAVQSAIENPNSRIDDLDILSDSIRDELVCELNQTGAPHAPDEYVHQVFEKQAERTPDAVAVVYQDQRLKFAELNQQANQLAHYLRTRGVGPDTRVGIAMERAPELVVALMGVLKSGAAYLPLDPAYPQERLSYMLADASVPVLLTQRRMLERLPKHGAETVCLDASWEEIGEQTTENPSSIVDSLNLAYVIYTSGSTGRPKGVMIPHQGLMNYLSWAVGNYRVEEGCGSLVHSSIAFDLTVTSLITPLLAGRTVFLVPEDETVESLAAAFSQGSDFSLVKLTPSHVSVLSQLLPNEAANAARALVIGGEALRGESLTFWREHAPETRIINEYGPTETVVGCCVYESPAGQIASGAVPVGKPIANTQIYVLDEKLRPQPFGVPGEIYIGGIDLARGYLNNADLTAEKFIPDPYGNSGQRLYRTGDLARYLSDGSIEYLGRVDHQVKVRGFRIELGEIEALLTEHPKVLQAVAVVREDRPNEQRLVAYVVSLTGEEIEAEELRRHLSSQLPAYMVPASFVRLGSLPLTSNGKVDRKALPEPERAAVASDGYQQARTGVEAALAEIWRDVLGLKQVGVHDNFFELGGDSILSIQIIAKANKAGLGITPKQIFQHQTVAELASVAGTARFVQAEQGLVTGSVPLTPIQHWFFEQELRDAQYFNQSTLLKIAPGFDYELFNPAIRALLEHHDALRLRFERARNTWRQFCEAAQEEVSLARVDLSVVDPDGRHAALRAGISTAHQSLDIAHGPVLRAVFFDYGKDEPGRLLLVIHHLIIDTVSWRILIEDLQTACEQLQSREPIKLPTKTTSYKEWAERLETYAQSAELRQEAGYWRELSDQDLVALPVDLTGENTVGSIDRVTFDLSSADTQALLQKVPAAFSTQINDVLLLALAQAFSCWTGQDKLLIDLDGHGREEVVDGVDLTRTVGWFTTIFPLLLEISQETNPRENLRGVRDRLRRLPNKGIGHGLLRYSCRDNALADELRRQPRAEVSFNYLGQYGRQSSEAGLFSSAEEYSGPDQSPSQKRKHLVDVITVVTADQLRMTWAYSRNLHKQQTIENLASEFVSALRTIIAHAASPEEARLNVDDFPLANLDQETLDSLSLDIAELDASEEYSI